MPTYAITAAAGLLSQEQRLAIVRAVTTIHHEETKAPRYLVQVVFYDLVPGAHFIGGEPAPAGQIWIRADIRAGRTDAQKSRMLQRILEDVGAVTGSREPEIYIYISDLPPQNMLEWGSILPEPGAEEAWRRTLPEDLGQRMRRMG